MNKEVKLKCPNCGTEFKTTNRNKIWCSKECSRRISEIKKAIKINERKQEQMLDDDYYYEIETDRMYIKKFMPKFKNK